MCVMIKIELNCFKTISCKKCFQSWVCKNDFKECQNGGTFVYNQGDCYCECPKPFKGAMCEIGEQPSTIFSDSDFSDFTFSKKRSTNLN